MVANAAYLSLISRQVCCIVRAEEYREITHGPLRSGTPVVLPSGLPRGGGGGGGGGSGGGGGCMSVADALGVVAHSIADGSFCHPGSEKDPIPQPVQQKLSIAGRYQANLPAPPTTLQHPYTTLTLTTTGLFHLSNPTPNLNPNQESHWAHTISSSSSRSLATPGGGWGSPTTRCCIEQACSHNHILHPPTHP